MDRAFPDTLLCLYHLNINKGWAEMNGLLSEYVRLRAFLLPMPSWAFAYALQKSTGRSDRVINS
jgi:hypothetical protein